MTTASHIDPRSVRSRAAITATAAELLLDAGPAGVTIDAVVARSGVARSTVYRHFATRTDVLRAAVDALVPPAVEVPDGAGAAAQLERYVIDFAESLRTSAWSRALPGLLEAVARDPGLEGHRRDLVARHRDPLRVILERAVAEGVLSPRTGLDDAAAILLGPLFYRRLVTGEPLTEELCRQLVDDLLHRREASQPPEPVSTPSSTALTSTATTTDPTCEDTR